MELETSTFVDDAWSSDAMLRDLKSRQCYYLVAERADESAVVDGYAGLLAPRGAQDADIQTIAVAAPARRAGLGRALMHALITEARKRGATQLFLEVRADNPGAQTLYEQLGFVAIAERPHYYQPGDVTAIVMRLKAPAPETTVAGS